MAEEQESTKIMYDTMPGAEPLEQGETLDLNFGLDVDGNLTEEDEVEEDVAEETENATVEEDPEPEPERASEEDGTEIEDQAQVEVAEDPEPLEEAVAEAPKKPMVPKSRLDEVLAKQKALQKQLDDIKAQQTPPEDAPEAFDYEAKELEYQNFLLDGESAKATQVRKEMRQAEREQIAFEMRQEMTQKVSQNAQANALQQAANDLEANFPVFDQNSADYNAEMTQEVIELRDAFMVQGFEAVDALSKAANFAIKSHNLESPSTLEAPSALTAKSVDEVAKKRAEVSKKLKAAESQPPELPGESSANRGEKPLDLSTMTEEEFNALPEATLRRLRGDI
ncbi:MAG: hypothetical protein CMJ25_21345 [Phycisphaerae bacterium]|nr:hypothetical protein [Phycisphaerae bacterium]|tara:strand:- start:450 stop:1463 length:1014 start_codon:yes stop_codon:yes gene_type:complete